ncbi:UNVERIFIED_CONTAM: hypothetical protein HDU68_004758 [Siphonaria sp. JEL0065]|nr:hypothetical protein HDU68_004758 [Siphonaria sp. JEL0065]
MGDTVTKLIKANLGLLAIHVRSFVGAQKRSVKAVMQRTFDRYLSFDRDNDELLNHLLSELVTDSIKYHYYRNGEMPDQVEVSLEELDRGVHVTEALILSAKTLAEIDVFNVLQTLCTTNIELGYVMYSWERGGPVAEHLYPNYHAHFARLVKIMPVVLYFPLLPQLYYLVSDLGNIPPTSKDVSDIIALVDLVALAFPGVLVITLDVFLIVCLLAT